MKVIIEISKPLLKDLIAYADLDAESNDTIEEIISYILHYHIAKYKDGKKQ